MENSTYISILIDTMLKKKYILSKLNKITLLQSEYIDSETLDMDLFNQTLLDKESLIKQLNQLDEGFENVYEHIKEELSSNKNYYKNEIMQLKELIKQITDESVRLQTSEMRNKTNIDTYFINQKREVKNFKLSNKTASNYYKNVANSYEGQSYFLDKKK